jgi:hypothetical protein
MKVATLLGAAAIAMSLHSCKPSHRRVDIDGYIPRDSANKMIRSYLASIDEDNDSNNPNLNSLIMNADMLRDYLSNPQITNVKLMFAHQLDYINSGNGGKNAKYSSNGLTIVIAGYNRLGNYVYAPGYMVCNHAMPCPRNCPVSGSASENTLQ